MYAYSEPVLMTCQKLWPVAVVSVTQMLPNATDGSATDPGAEPRADVQTQREPMAPTTHKNTSFISAPASGSLLDHC